ncbi:MAG: nucleotidyltransferase [Bacteroides sp.]|nr:nucleotidyltransferase [Bacteroides sp.]
MKLIETNIRYIIELCKIYKVKSLYVFGSILTSRFHEDSDVDLLVKFNKEHIPLSEYADNYFDFQFALENLFKRKVDLVCDDAIKNPFFRQEVDSKKQLIYG